MGRGMQLIKWKILTEKQLNEIIQKNVDLALEQDTNAYKREMLLKQANLTALQSQINPHFLYNTLECIRGMALINNERDIADIAQALSSFFRYSISGNRNIVSLQDELDNVAFYIKIQKYRFRDRFRVEMKCSEELYDASIPKLTLQPVIENAIVHGMSDITSGGEIKINVERLDQDILITMSDNGKGMDTEALTELTERIMGRQNKNKSQNHSGIGMHNVDQRLKLHFGSKYGITVYSMKHVGTDVIVRIPYQPLKE